MTRALQSCGSQGAHMSLALHACALHAASSLLVVVRA
jgi:hypothetical protein